MSHRAVAALAVTLMWAPPVLAQSISNSDVRLAPQIVEYRLRAPIGETITEFAVPIFVVVPVSSMLNFDIGTAYTSTRVTPNGANTDPRSAISGLTDTQIRVNAAFGADFLVLTAGLNVPTGRETATPEQELAAFRIGSDFLAFPISNMGTGFGVTGGVAVARPIGTWNLGVGGSVRQSAAYEPFEQTGGARPRFQPGNEYRARVGLDHPFGTGRIGVGFTYSKFGNDDIGGSIYNTGDRYIGQAGVTGSIGGPDMIVTVWNLYRRSGTIVTGERTGPEDIANVLLGVGIHRLGGVLEPSIEMRQWWQENLKASFLATFGVRYSLRTGGFVVTPSAGYATGGMATTTGNAALSGFRAAVAVRIGQ